MGCMLKVSVSEVFHKTVDSGTIASAASLFIEHVFIKFIITMRMIT